MNIEWWVRRPKPLNGVRVTTDNISEVAQWCKSPIDTSGKNPCIAVNFKNPGAERRHKAYPGDYVIQLGGGFKIYTAKAFVESFEPAPVVHYEEEQ